LEKNNAVLQSHLENQGFFRAGVTGETRVKNRRAKAIYTVQPGAQYTINKVKFQEDSSQLLRAINRTKRRTLLKVGEPFDLEVVKEERMRIDTRLKQRGFYFFSPDHLLIDVDSTIGEQRVNLYVNLKPTTP